ncbi:MAG: Dickkopf N-terminal cysteine-rich domain-containing protein [Myxococcota bacterium]
MAGFVASCSAVSLTRPDGGVPDGGTSTGDGGFDAGVVVVQDAGLPLEAACEVLNRHRCEYLQRCGLIGQSGGDLERCELRFTATWCGPGLWPLRVTGPTQTLRYDGRVAQDCADAFATRSCAEWEGLPDSCGNFLKPAANLRQACYDGYVECVEGVCRGGACPRTCQPRGVAGEVCRQDSDCVARLFCRPSTTTPGVGTCTAWASVNEACDPDSRCLEGLWCHMNQCLQLPAAGQPCLYGRCDVDAFCDASLDGGTCLARKSRGTGCLPGQCLPELLCGALSGVCEPLELDSAGVPCTGEQRCPAGTVCVGWTANAPGTCEAPHTEGEPCTRHDDCKSHLACLPADGGLVCGRRLEDGQPCADSRACSVLSTCAAGECAKLREPGQACDVTKACLWGPCVDAGTAGLKCVPPLGPGASCSSAAQCASGRCEQGVCLASCAP